MQQGIRADWQEQESPAWNISNVISRYHKHPVYRYLLQLEPDNPVGEIRLQKAFLLLQMR